MKTLKQTGHQGDVQIFTIDSIPSNAKKVSKQFIAASEKSGHVHALTGDYDMYETEDGFIMDCHEDCILNHTSKELLNDKWDKPVKLPQKEHRHSALKKGLYIVGIQNRFDPMENVKKKVVD